MERSTLAGERLEEEIRQPGAIVGKESRLETTPPSSRYLYQQRGPLSSLNEVLCCLHMSHHCGSGSEIYTLLDSKTLNELLVKPSSYEGGINSTGQT